MRTKISLALALAAVLSVASVTHAQETPRMGGVLKVASIGEPPTLDIQATTTVLTYEIMWHVYEPLFAHDRDWNPIPHLVDTHAVSDRGLRHTMTLRKGVKFHNGKEMTSADVVASLKRWGQVATVGKGIWPGVESIEAKDPYTVVIFLKQPSGSLLYALSEPSTMIYTKEAVDAAGTGPIKEYVGTGPYRFVEHRPDRHIKLVRFKDYTARAEPANAFGGKRTAWLDEILFIPVPDTAVRQAGVETGEYHHAMFMKQDNWDRIKAMPQIESRIVKPRGWTLVSLNHKAGLMTSKPLRQAIQAALDMEPIMLAAFGHKDFYRLGPALFFPEQTAWHAPAPGAPLYNQRDRDKAKRLMKEAGYAGQTVRWLSTKEYEFMYKSSLMAKQQLEAVGFVIDLQVLDWAALNQRAQKPEMWEAYVTGYPLNPDPALHVAFRCSFQGWWCHEEKERLLAEMRQETDVKKRKALLERIQAIHYEDVGQVKLGDYYTLDLARKELRGDFRTAPRLYFWNSWLAK
jgi:peptide/nickel transport system substrate-binding protein